ncbi:iron chelate uptake ABC transporter family permease subunit [Bacillus paralicheniformis]|jgi:iron complex transport system permease protein|uniref:Iron-uptake system permease protein FeuC n=1 Tax=Bacillus paralicheniformis TaxID=1648923 RepID=A0A6I7TWK7_9BACI|nr:MULTISPECIES: iron chelate uptake ABC transporter family permease subunit [Bacillus]KJD55880.1 iron ABC transporter permease [Bacillus amyloliquefaciens]KUL14710.1 iron ABC transporter permease [Bacillus licheniformis LMG 7559]MBC8622983.1 iron chelate uptake ABC transporter family permease subunit [Robertmurraya crescens]AGN34895.1 putative ferrichrome ABC transporter permease protein YclO [Bacillus paralicheniformis ATCC 9945a]AJO16612.1 transport system permease [Bacillus paralicheniform
MRHKQKMLILIVIAAACIGLFLFYGLPSVWEYALPRRFAKVFAIIVVGTAIAYSSMIFQTITNNRILTPSILGLDSLYVLLQTGIIYFFGAAKLADLGKNGNFLLSTGLMVCFSFVLFFLMFRRGGRHIFLLLLVGIVCGTLFRSLSSFMQMLIDPNEFQVVQNKMFASFNNLNTDILMLASLIILAILVYAWRYNPYFDVISLGRDQAVNLGIDYDRTVKKMLIVVAVLVSVSTALVGPITFLGLLVVNVAREVFKTYKHSVLIPGAVLFSIIALVGGQFIVEKLFGLTVTLVVIIDFIGGIYFIYLLLKERK